MATYYVRKTGNDGNPGTSGSPWLTIQHACDNIAAGDTVIVGDGTYNEAIDINASGNASNRITFESENPLGAVIDGSGTGDDYVVNFKGGGIERSYITFDGFEVCNGQKVGIRIQGNYHIVTNCCVHDCGAANTDANTCVQTKYADYLTFTYNEIYSCGWNAFAHEIGHYATIEHNYVHDNPYHNGIDMKPTAGTPQVDQVGNNVMYNRTTGCTNGIYMRRPKSNVVANNLSWENSKDGINVAYDTATNIMRADMLIANNTLVNNTGYGFDDESATHITFRNNIWYGNGAGTWRIFSPANIGHVYSNNLGTDPNFTDEASDDYTLAAGSAAIDTGYNMAAYYTEDLVGTTRPQGSTFDIGCYEYVQGAHSTNLPPYRRIIGGGIF